MELNSSQVSRINNYKDLDLNAAASNGTVLSTAQLTSGGELQGRGWTPLAPAGEGHKVLTRPMGNASLPFP